MTARKGLMMNKKTSSKGRQMPNPGNRRFHTWYRHYRTGKIMIASEYGYKSWPF